MEWTVLIAVKALPEAKSRLLGATADAGAHGALVGAIRADTVRAALLAPGVARVVLVVDRPQPAPEGVLVVVQHSRGLNGALRDGAELAADRWPDDGIAALVGDLPALRPDELGGALGAAADHLHAFVADAAGTGTTLLTAAPGQALRPAFGPDSAVRHAVHSSALDAGAGLRHDVDTADDLDAAVALGVGPSTAQVVSAPSPSSYASAPCSAGTGPPCSSGTGIVGP